MESVQPRVGLSCHHVFVLQADWAPWRGTAMNLDRALLLLADILSGIRLIMPGVRAACGVRCRCCVLVRVLSPCCTQGLLRFSCFSVFALTSLCFAPT